MPVNTKRLVIPKDTSPRPGSGDSEPSMGGGSSSTPANTSTSVNLFHSPGPDVTSGMTLVVRRGQKHSRDSNWNTAQVLKLVDAGYKEKYHLNTRKVDKK